jgi:hypothetical protein
MCRGNPQFAHDIKLVDIVLRDCVADVRKVGVVEWVWVDEVVVETANQHCKLQGKSAVNDCVADQRRLRY